MQRETKSLGGKKRAVVDTFETVGEFIEYTCDKSHKIRSGLVENSHDTDRDGFFWTKDWKEACKLWQTGWADGTAKVIEHREGLQSFVTAAATAKSRKFGFDVVGDFVDVGRYLSGEPEVFGTEFDQGDSIRGRVVSIRLNASVSGGVSADTICARGVTTLVAVDLLESIGVQCEVIVACGARGNGGLGADPNLGLYDFNVTVKAAGEAVDPDRLAFTVAHPSFFRRFGFRCEEIAGYSPSSTAPAKLQDYEQRKGVIEIDHILSGASLSREELQKNVLAIAAKCGIEFSQEQIDELIAGATNDA
jgi:hypothetical protein